MKMDEIERRIQDEFDTFYSEVYPAKLPKFFLELFKKCVMELSPRVFQLKFTEIQSIVGKELNQLTNMDVRKMNNIFMETPLKAWDVNFEKALAKYKEIQLIIFECNVANKEKQSELNKKKESLVNLSGINIGGKKLYTA